MSVAEAWDQALKDAAEARAQGVGVGYHILLARHGTRSTGRFSVVSTHKRACCGTTLRTANRSRDGGYFAHVTPDGEVCCFVGRGSKEAEARP